MSRIGKRPLILPEGVELEFKDGQVMVRGPKGVLTRRVPAGLVVERDGNRVIVKTQRHDRQGGEVHGLIRSLVANMITGVSEGYRKWLEISGVGYKADLKRDKLVLYLGYTRPWEYTLPEGIKAKLEKPTRVMIEGIDKELVGQVGAQIRALRRIEPYKGTGVRYADEVVRRKAGKSGVR